MSRVGAYVGLVWLHPVRRRVVLATIAMVVLGIVWGREVLFGFTYCCTEWPWLCSTFGIC